MARHFYVVKERIVTPGKVILLTLAPQSGGPIFNFTPGQYATLAFRDAHGRLFLDHPFSIASAPTNTKEIQFGIKIFGNFTQNLSALEPGSPVTVNGPFGTFVFNEHKHQNLVLIAGGIGITPFISAVRYATDRKLSNKITLFYSVRTIADATFYNELVALAKENPNFTFVPTVTKEEPPHDVEKGFITPEMISRYVTAPQSATFMLCGPPKFMEAMQKGLRSLGVAQKRILSEAFSKSVSLPLRESYGKLFLVYGTIAAVVVFFFSTVYTVEKNRGVGKDVFTTTIAGSDAPAINTLVAERRNEFLSSQAQALADVKRNISRQLNFEQTVFKQETTVTTPNAPSPTPTIVTPTEPVVSPAPTPTPKPRTTVS